MPTVARIGPYRFLFASNDRTEWRPTNGVFNKPTALNNVETFANVPQILVNGVDWYKSQGQGGAAGLKFVGVSGDVRKPGIFLIPMGLPVADVIPSVVAFSSETTAVSL